MPFFGKSGTSRINFFRGSQFTAALVPITTLLRYETYSDPKSGGLPILLHRRHAPPADLRASASVILTTDRACPWRGSRRCRRGYSAPIRRFPTLALPSPQTTSSHPPARHQAHNN